MMIEGLLHELHREGVQIWSENGRVRYRARKGAMTPERIAEIRAQQHEITTFLEEAQSLAGELPPVTPACRTGILPLSFAQERLWFLNQLGFQGPSYNIATTIQLEGKLDTDALARSFAEVVRRHESLRTRFEAVDGRGVQMIEQWKKHDLPLIDLSTLAPDERQATACRLRRDNAAQFDASNARFFQGGSVALAAENGRDDFIHMRRMAEAKNGLDILVFGEFAKKRGGFRAGEKDIRLPDFLFWIFHRGGEQFRGLHRANVR